MSSYVIEDERGTCTTKRHRHNGYYAGEFADRSVRTRPAAVTVFRAGAVELHA
jgi:hypothetical protein